MPITYVVDHEAGLIRTRCLGNVTLDEVVAHFRELAGTDPLPPRLHVLLDLSEMESLPETDQLRAVTTELKGMQSKLSWGSWAIVANRDALFGMSRILEVFAEKSFTGSRVFRDVDEAESWLAASRTQTGQR